MSRGPARSVGGHGIETFLLHLAAEGVISSAQLLRAQEALRLWTPAIAVTPEGDTEEQQPLQRPGIDADKEQPWCGHQDQLFPQVAVTLCRLDSSQLIQEEEDVLPTALPREADAEGPLSLLPDTLLDDLMSLLAAEPGASCIRRTCSWLRSAFDRCNARLVLRQLEGGQLLPPPPQTLQLLLSGPRITSLAMEEVQQLTVRSHVAISPWDILYSAGPSMHRLESLSLRHLDTSSVPSLTHCTKLKRLGLHDCIHLDDLRDLASCVELRRLDMRGCRSVEDLGPLASCARLQQLDIGSCEKVQELGPLASCVKLQHLSLRGCKLLEDISPLAACVELQHLDLSYSAVSDLGPLAECVRLQHLDLSRCDQLQDLGPLSACAELQHLDLQRCYEVEDLAPLVTCTGLLFLRVACVEVEDIRALAACTRLQSFTALDAEFLDDLSPLAACSRLQYLYLDTCNSVADLSPLAACVELRHLRLSEGYDVQHLGPLAACVKLRYLELLDCVRVKDLGPLASCVDLQVLSILRCLLVEDLWPLSGCVKLQYLDLRGCENARDPQPLALCGELRVLEVSTACMAAEDLAPLAALSRLTILWE